MALDEGALARLRPRRLTATLYLRQVFIPPEGDPTPYFVRPHEGRWGTEWTLHATTSPPTAWAEYCRHVPELVEAADPTGGIGLGASSLAGLAFIELGDPVLRRALFALTYSFSRVLDVVVEQQVLSDAGFNFSNLYTDDFGLCPDLARWAAEAGFEALLAPSAAWRHKGGTVCAVFTQGRARQVSEDVVVASARPTVAVAAGTTYKRSETPAWLRP